MSNKEDIRLTQPTLKVLRCFLEKPRQGQSGAEISKAAKVGAGTLYPFLARLETAGWVTSEWEAVEPRDAGRPRQRFYRLTGIGYRNAYAALKDLQFTPSGDFAWTL